MAIPVNKEQLQDAIETHYQKLVKELASIPAELTGVQNMEGHAKGTLMSVHNLVAYLVGWGALVLRWNEGKDRNETVDFPETGYKWNELGKLAQKFYADYEDYDFDALKVLLGQTVSEILGIIARKSDAVLYGEAWYGKWTLGRMIQFNTSSPYQNAYGRIRKWKKEHGIS